MLLAHQLRTLTDDVPGQHVTQELHLTGMPDEVCRCTGLMRLLRYLCAEQTVSNKLVLFLRELAPPRKAFGQWSRDVEIRVNAAGNLANAALKDFPLRTGTDKGNPTV